MIYHQGRFWTILTNMSKKLIIIGFFISIIGGLTFSAYQAYLKDQTSLLPQDGALLCSCGATKSIPPQCLPCSSPTLSPSPVIFTCPTSSWVDCMPGPDKPNPQCAKEYLEWARANCPGFEGAAL